MRIGTFLLPSPVQMALSMVFVSEHEAEECEEHCLLKLLHSLLNFILSWSNRFSAKHMGSSGEMQLSLRSVQAPLVNSVSELFAERATGSGGCCLQQVNS